MIIVHKGADFLESMLAVLHYDGRSANLYKRCTHVQFKVECNEGGGPSLNRAMWHCG